jgi:hypothetical protein
MRGGFPGDEAALPPGTVAEVVGKREALRSYLMDDIGEIERRGRREDLADGAEDNRGRRWRWLAFDRSRIGWVGNTREKDRPAERDWEENGLGGLFDRAAPLRHFSLVLIVKFRVVRIWKWRKYGKTDVCTRGKGDVVEVTISVCKE